MPRWSRNLSIYRRGWTGCSDTWSYNSRVTARRKRCFNRLNWVNAVVVLQASFWNGVVWQTIFCYQICCCWDIYLPVSCLLTQALKSKAKPKPAAGTLSASSSTAKLSVKANANVKSKEFVDDSDSSDDDKADSPSKKKKVRLWCDGAVATVVAQLTPSCC